MDLLYSTERITPEKAKEYLSKNVNNRPLSRDTVNNYAELMKKGKWVLNAQTISFTADGYLIDGQHRLTACVQANIPFTTSVVRGVERSTFSSIDCGRNRRLGQLIGMQGVKHYNIVAGTFNFAQALISNGKIETHNAKRKGVGYTNVEKMELFEQDKEGYIKAANIACSLTGKSRLLEHSLVGGTIYFLERYCGYNLDFICKFFDGLLSISSSDNKAIEIFRQRLWNEKCGVKKTARPILYALLIKTWNMYVTGKWTKCLKYTEEKEDYPEFIKIKV